MNWKIDKETRRYTWFTPTRATSTKLADLILFFQIGRLQFCSTSAVLSILLQEVEESAFSLHTQFSNKRTRAHAPYTVTQKMKNLHYSNALLTYAIFSQVKKTMTIFRTTSMYMFPHR